MIRQLTEDLRQALRALLRRPGPTLLAACLLALALGASFVVWSWLNGLVLRPYPGVGDGNKLLLMGGVTAKGNRTSVSSPDFMDLRSAARPDLSIAAAEVTPLSLTANDGAARVWGAIVTSNYFELLGLTPQHGSFFVADDDLIGQPAKVVVSDAFFRREMGGDPRAVGQTLELNRHTFTVVGVTPTRFQGTEVGLQLDLFVPHGLQPFVQPGNRLAERGSSWLKPLVRLGPGMTRESAQERLDALAVQLATVHPENTGKRFQLYRLHQSPWGASKFLTPMLAALTAFVALVLIAAWANVANLLLVGALARRREMAVRLALGARHSTLLRQLAAESLLTAALAVGLGSLVLPFSRDLFLAFLPPTPFPVLPDTSLGASGWLVGVILILATTLVFGLAPLGVVRSLRLAGVMREEAGSLAGSVTTTRLRRALLVLQVAVCAVLLSAAALFTRAAARGTEVPPGFATEGIALAAIDLQAAGYDQPRATALLTRLSETLTSRQDVVAVSWSRRLPLDIAGSSSTTLEIDGYTPASDEEVLIFLDRCGPNFFSALGVPLLAGREFTIADVATSERVALVNRAMADRYWGGDAVGGTFRFDGDTVVRVVGVVDQIKHESLDEAPIPFFWLPHTQAYRPDIWLVARTTGDPAALLPDLRAALTALDPAVPLFSAKTMTEHLTLATMTQRMAAALLGGFGLIALLLVTLGLYGVVAWNVERRTRELAVRAALGAAPRLLVRTLLAQGAWLGAAGLVAGLGLAAAGVRLLRSQLLGVSPFDPLAFAAAAAVLLAAILVATWIPARRVLRLDPATALRAE